MAYVKLEDEYGRITHVPVFNEAEDGSGTWHVPVCDTSGYLKVSLQSVLDDVLWKLGTDGDIVALNRSTILAADAELADVIVGTSDHPGVAANSLILSNITASGDLLFLVNKGGNSLAAFWADGSTGDTALLAASGQSVDMYIGGSKIFDLTNDGTKSTLMGLTGDYWRIGDAATTENSLDSEDDLMVTGQLEVYHDAFFGRQMTLTGGTFTIISSAFQVYNDIPINLGGGNDVHILYESADADAKILAFLMDESADSGNNVPVFAFMEHTGAAANLGLFDAFVEPLVCVVDNDKDSWCGVSFSADDVPILSTNRTGANGIVITNPKNAAASALSGTQLDVEIDIGGTPYHYTVYPTKA